MSPLSFATDLSEETFKNEVLSNHGTVLVGFYSNESSDQATVCSRLNAVSEECSNSIRCFGINADHFEELKKSYGLDRLPSFFVFQDGEVMQRIIGPVSRQVLRVLVNRYA